MKGLKFDFIVVILTVLISGYLMYSRVVFFRNKIKQKDTYTRGINSLVQEPQVRSMETQQSSPPSPVLRNILFKHRASSSVKKVSIVGDFNDWTPEPMNKDPTGVWTIVLRIPPGYYAYNFIVDGRPQRDLNNPRTIDTGRGFISSYLEVKPK